MKSKIDTIVVMLEFMQFRWSFLQGSTLSYIMTQNLYLYTLYEKKTEDILQLPWNIAKLKAQECDTVLKKDWPTAPCGYEHP